MKKKLILTIGVSILVSACGGSSSSDSSGLGAAIDAMGRAAINTALINTFADDATRGAAEDNFNSSGAGGDSSFADTMAGQLAIYDSLAGACGDNPLTTRVSADPADGTATGAGRYDFLAAVLADDQLYVNSASGGAEGGQCNQYLAAELGVVGIPGLGADCGGRTPNHDVIETTYSAVAIGAAAGVDDGVASDNVTHSLTVFPFLAAPVG